MAAGLRRAEAAEPVSSAFESANALGGFINWPRRSLPDTDVPVNVDVESGAQASQSKRFAVSSAGGKVAKSRIAGECGGLPPFSEHGVRRHPTHSGAEAPLSKTPRVVERARAQAALSDVRISADPYCQVGGLLYTDPSPHPSPIRWERVPGGRVRVTVYCIPMIPQ